MSKKNRTVGLDPFHLGNIVSGDVLGSQLHDAAISGNTRQLKNVLKRGINVDYPNDAGQTPLFCSCYANQERTVQILLSYGANPNEKSNDGTTPIHATSYTGNINLLVSLIKAGGDLRLHDRDGKTANDWAALQPDPTKRYKMLEFLEKSHLFAMTHSGGDSASKLLAEGTLIEKKRSIVQMIKKKVAKVPSVTYDPLRRVNSTGFGCVYIGSDDHGAIVSTIPLVSESNLHHDPHGITYENGAYLVMESMTWCNSAVTVKRLHHDDQPGGYIDLLITEMGNMGKIRHPNILLLMGVCQTNSLDNMVLVFERIGLGSLYYYLHQRLERLPTQNIRDILLQICSALVFIHQQNYIHCGLSSHAINLVNPYIAKLGNFEYMTQSSKSDMGKQSSVSDHISQNALYNWMAPELMLNEPATYASDVYSYCCIIWEMFENEVPWDMCEASFIKHKLTVEQKTVPMNKSKIPEPFRSIAQQGLNLKPEERSITFDQINQGMFGHLDQAATNFSPEKSSVTFSPSRTKKINSQKSKASKYSPDSSEGDVAKQKQRYENTGSQRSLDKKSDLPRNIELHQKQSNENHNYGPWDMHEQWMISYPKNDSGSDICSQDMYSEDGNSTEKYFETPPTYYTDKSGYKFTRFCTGKSDWTCEITHRQEGDRFGYAAEIHKVMKPENRVKTIMRAEVEGFLKREAELLESRQSSPAQPDKRQIFSYMTVDRALNDTNDRVCKPATHWVDPNNPKSNSLKLSSAGSLFALYNVGVNPDESFRQPVSPSVLHFSQKLHTSIFDKDSDDENVCSVEEQKVEKDKCEKKERLKPDPHWYGGKGSVKNLVHVYQDHVEDHLFQQSVLEGKLAPKHNTGDQNKLLEPELDKTSNHSEMPHISDPEVLAGIVSKDNEIPWPSDSLACLMEREPSDAVGHVESDFCVTGTEMELTNVSLTDTHLECPDLTNVTTASVTPVTKSVSPESVTSIDSVSLEFWIREQLERLRQEIINDEDEDVEIKNEFSIKIYYHLDGSNEADAKEMINLHKDSAEDKNIPNLDVSMKRENNESNKNMEPDNQLVKMMNAPEKQPAGTKRTDNYLSSKRDSDGSLLKEVMEELSRSQAKRRAQRRVPGNEFDLREYYIDDEIEKSGLKLGGGRENWTLPKLSPESGMTNKSELTSSTGFSDRTLSVRDEKKDRIVQNKSNVVPKPTVTTRTSERKPKSKSKGYTTTVTVTSSIDRPGEHQLKHTATDLDTGEIKTLHEQKVLASSVVSKIIPQ